METKKNVTIERIVKLEDIGNKLKKEMAELRREPAVILYHPSRLPKSSEFNELFMISEGHAVEHDIRASADKEYSIQQGMFTDRLKAWESVNTIEKFIDVFGAERSKELMELVKERAKSTDRPSMDTIKKNLFVKDLKLTELQKFAAIGGEEILGMGQFLNLYENAIKGSNKPGKLSVDIKDGDLTLSGSIDKAIEATKVFMEEIKVRKLTDNLYMVMQYNVPALENSIKLFDNIGVPSVGIISSDLIKKEGETAFAQYASMLVNNHGAKWIGTKSTELKIVEELITVKKPNMMVYVPPKESSDISYLVTLLRDYPSVKALQIDA